MEATTVDEAVSSLKELYAEGTEHYTHWKRKRTLGNHYCRKSSETGIRRDVITCALSISLELARNQIEETHDIATVLIGTDFSTGDSECPPHRRRNPFPSICSHANSFNSTMPGYAFQPAVQP